MARKPKQLPYVFARSYDVPYDGLVVIYLIVLRRRIFGRLIHVLDRDDHGRFEVGFQHTTSPEEDDKDCHCHGDRQTQHRHAVACKTFFTLKRSAPSGVVISTYLAPPIKRLHNSGTVVPFPELGFDRDVRVGVKYHLGHG